MGDGRNGWGLAAVSLIGLALRVYYLGEPMRSDEAYTYNEYATRSLYDAVSLYTFPNNHLFHTLLVHGSVRLFGGAPWVVRLPALVAGLALIPATYAMVRRLCDPLAGLFAAALVAASDPLVSYSVNGRGYTLLCLITALLVTTADRLRGGGRLADWLAFAALPAFGYFTIPVMLYPHGGVVLWLVLGRLAGRSRGPRFDRLFVALMASGFLAFLLYTPTLARTGLGSVVANQFVKPRPFAEVGRELPGSLLEVWWQWNLDIPGAVVVGFVAAWAAALVVPTPGRAGARRITGLTLTVFAWSLGVVLYQHVVPFDRVWLFLLPLYLGMVASGLGALAGRGRAVWPVLLALALAGLVVRSGSIPKDSQRLTINHGDAIARRLKPALAADDAVIAELPCEGPLKYYFLTHRMPVEPLYDYRIARARRLFIVVNRPNGQTPEGVLRFNRIAAPFGRSPRLLEDYGRSALYVLERW